MQMSETLDIRLESGLKEMIEGIAEGKDSSISDITRDLIWLGIGLKKEGGVEISGPLGAGRPLANLDFGGESVRLAVRIDENLIQTLQNTFEDRLRTAARQAIRLGSLIVWPEEISIKGPFGTIRPFTQIEMPVLENEEARKALERLQK